MNESNLPFSGRIIFDHLQKTAGQAVNAWLRLTLGEGNVTENMTSSHRLAIKRYGGEYSVISGHLIFDDALGLDRRYKYLTCLREPVDRSASWLYFLVNNHDDRLGVIYHQAKQFIESDGAELGEHLAETLRDIYINHFCDVAGSRTGSDDERVARALQAAGRYDVLGVYEDLPGFTRDIARLLRVASPDELASINPTSARPPLANTPPGILARLDELTRLDQRFYRDFRNLLEHRHQSSDKDVGSDHLPIQNWELFPPKPRKILLDPRGSIDAVRLVSDAEVRVGKPVSAKVDITLTVDIDDLEIGAHIYDEDWRWAFGTNSVLLGQKFPPLKAGTHSFIFSFLADLPLGKYALGFSLADKTALDTSSFVWHDELASFWLVAGDRMDFAGYRRVPAAVRLIPKALDDAPVDPTSI